MKMYNLEEDAAKQLEDRPGSKSTIKLVPPPHVGMQTVRHIQDSLEPDPEPQSEPESMQDDPQSASGQTDDSQQQARSTAGEAAAIAVARRRDGSVIAIDESGQPLDLSVRLHHLDSCDGLFGMLT